MRTTLLGNMLKVVSRNMNRGVKELSAFELGNLFIPKALPVTELPEEKMSVCMAQVGQAIDFYAFKGAVEALLEGMNMRNVDFVPVQDNPSFHPGRAAKMVVDGIEIGTMGQIHPATVEQFDIDQLVFAAEMDMKIFHQLADDKKVYQPLPKYPAISRDLALLVPLQLPSKTIEKAMVETGGKLVESAKLFDVYMGAPVPEGWKSLAYSIAYRAKDRTLTDEEVSKVQGKILDRLEKDFEAKLR
jgi:phenylalanyl-tRNA synthetase beta chain